MGGGPGGGVLSLAAISRSGFAWRRSPYSSPPIRPEDDTPARALAFAAPTGRAGGTRVFCCLVGALAAGTRSSVAWSARLRRGRGASSPRGGHAAVLSRLRPAREPWVSRPKAGCEREASAGEVARRASPRWTCAARGGGRRLPLMPTATRVGARRPRAQQCQGRALGRPRQAWCQTARGRPAKAFAPERMAAPATRLPGRAPCAPASLPLSGRSASREPRRPCRW